MVTVVVVTATMVTTAVGEDELSAVYGGGEPTVVVAAVVLRGIPPKTSFTLRSILSIGYTTLYCISQRVSKTDMEIVRDHYWSQTNRQDKAYDCQRIQMA